MRTKILQRIIYIAGFAWLMYLDNIVGSANGWTQAALRVYTGVIFGVFSLTAYKGRDFLKIPYFVWVAVLLIIRPFLFRWAEENQFLVVGVYPPERLYAYFWMVFVYGIIFIRMIYLYAVEKEKPGVHWIWYVMWLIFMLCMIFSESDLKWPFSFLVSFGIFYLTNFSREQLNNMFSGMMEGIVIGFLYVQWQACLHRPYDELRYEGMFGHPSMMALFCLIAYCALLCIWYRMKLKRSLWIGKIVSLLLIGFVVSLLLFTMSRTALIAFAGLTFWFVVFLFLSSRKRKIWNVIISIFLMVVSVVGLFKPTYNLIRYMPAYTNDPIYIEGENINKKIQVDEPFDSPKYTGYDEAIEGIFERLDRIKEFMGDTFPITFFPVLYVNAAEENEILQQMKPGTSSDNSLDVKYGPLDGRVAIWKFYLENLNLRGHLFEENGVWISSNYRATHGHNFFLQFAFDFGLPVGILLVILILGSYFAIIRGMCKRKRGDDYYRYLSGLLYITLFVLFAAFDLCWLWGQLPMTLLFMMFRFVVHKEVCKEVSKEVGKEVIEEVQIS